MSNKQVTQLEQITQGFEESFQEDKKTTMFNKLAFGGISLIAATSSLACIYYSLNNLNNVHLIGESISLALISLCSACFPMILHLEQESDDKVQSDFLKQLNKYKTALLAQENQSEDEIAFNSIINTGTRYEAKRCLTAMKDVLTPTEVALKNLRASKKYRNWGF